MNTDTIRTLIEPGLPGARADVHGDDGVHFEATVVCEAGMESLKSCAPMKVTLS